MSGTPIPDATILAAVDRAALHSEQPGASIGVILEHPRSASTDPSRWTTTP
jgi:hypothetical protein